MYQANTLSNPATLGFPRGLAVKNPPVMQKMQETWVQSLGQEDPPEEGMATHSSILAWRIPKDRGTWQATVQGVMKSRTEATEHAYILLH